MERRRYEVMNVAFHKGGGLKNLFPLLGIKQAALVTHQEAKKAANALLARLHPDKLGGEMTDFDREQFNYASLVAELMKDKDLFEAYRRMWLDTFGGGEEVTSMEHVPGSDIGVLPVSLFDLLGLEMEADYADVYKAFLAYWRAHPEYQHLLSPCYEVLVSAASLEAYRQHLRGRLSSSLQGAELDSLELSLLDEEDYSNVEQMTPEELADVVFDSKKEEEQENLEVEAVKPKLERREGQWENYVIIVGTTLALGAFVYVGKNYMEIDTPTKTTVTWENPGEAALREICENGVRGEFVHLDGPDLLGREGEEVQVLVNHYKDSRARDFEGNRSGFFDVVDVTCFDDRLPRFMAASDPRSKDIVEVFDADSELSGRYHFKAWEPTHSGLVDINLGSNMSLSEGGMVYMGPKAAALFYCENQSGRMYEGCYEDWLIVDKYF